MAAVDSQLQQVGDEWPEDAATDLLLRIRGDLAEQMARMDALVAEVEGDGGADEPEAA